MSAPGASHPPFSSRSAARVRKSDSNGGSRNTMSKGRPAPPRNRNASPCSTSAPLAPHSESRARSSRAAAASRSTKVTWAAPRERDSRPSAPLPAKRSRQRAPGKRAAIQLKRVSRTRSGVGRISGEGGKRSFLPRHLPPMMRSTRAWPARLAPILAPAGRELEPGTPGPAASRCEAPLRSRVCSVCLGLAPARCEPPPRLRDFPA